MCSKCEAAALLRKEINLLFLRKINVMYKIDVAKHSMYPVSVGYTMCTIDRHSIYVYTQSIVKKSLIHESMNATRQSLEEQLDCNLLLYVLENILQNS